MLYLSVFSRLLENKTLNKNGHGIWIHGMPLNEDREKEIERLDIRYEAMSAEFQAYASLITKMDSGFSSLQSLIQMQYADN